MICLIFYIYRALGSKFKSIYIHQYKSILEKLLKTTYLKRITDKSKFMTKIN
jgi:hypothetical protein